MANCSNCGASVDDKANVCPHCGKPTRLNSPGFLGGSGLEFLIAFVVVGGALYFILSPLSSGPTNKARLSRQLSLARGVGFAFEAYTTDHDDCYPPIETSEAVAELIDPYLNDANKEVRKFAQRSTWNKEVSLMRKSEISNRTEVYLNWHIDMPDALNTMVTFLDGHAKHVTGDWDTFLKVEPKVFKPGK
ncbi:MAG: zinc ribbon domain-containing protein [Armatimonadota bacterium]